MKNLNTRALFSHVFFQSTYGSDPITYVMPSSLVPDPSAAPASDDPPPAAHSDNLLPLEE